LFNYFIFVKNIL